MGDETRIIKRAIGQRHRERIKRPKLLAFKGGRLKRQGFFFWVLKKGQKERKKEGFTQRRGEDFFFFGEVEASRFGGSRGFF